MVSVKENVPILQDAQSVKLTLIGAQNVYLGFMKSMGSVKENVQILQDVLNAKSMPTNALNVYLDSTR